MAGVDKTVATLEVRLDDQTSGPAKTAARALSDLQAAIKRDTKELGEMQRAMKALQGGTVVNIDQFRKLKAQIDAKKEAIAKAQSSFLGLGGTFRSSAGEAKRTTSSYAELAAAARGSGGALGAMAGRVQSIGALMSSGTAIAIGLAAGIAAVSAALVAGVAALARYAIGQADARRSELLRLEGLASIRTWMGYTATTGTALQASLDAVAASTSLSRSEVARYAEGLHKAGVRGDNLTVALRGVATVAAVQGEEQAQLYASMMSGAILAGQSVDALSARIQQRLGGIAAKQMLSLNVQIAKARESYDALFRSVNIEPFLAALSQVTSMFSQATASGRALQELLAIVLAPIVSAATAGLPIVKRFFQGMILMAQDLTIVALDAAIWLRKMFGSDLLRGIDLTTAAIWAGRSAVIGMTLALAPFAAIASVMGAGLSLFAGILTGVVWWMGKLASVATYAVRFFREVDWRALGTAMVDGIVSGLRRGLSVMRSAVTDLGRAAIESFRSALGIASPSKVFARLGVELPRGLEQGIAKGAPDAQAAAGGMIEAPSAAGQRPAMRTINLSIGEITVSGAGGSSAEIASTLRSEIERVFADLALSMGAA